MFEYLGSMIFDEFYEEALINVIQRLLRQIGPVVRNVCVFAFFQHTSQFFYVDAIADPMGNLEG